MTLDFGEVHVSPSRLVLLSGENAQRSASNWPCWFTAAKLVLELPDGEAGVALHHPFPVYLLLLPPAGHHSHGQCGQCRCDQTASGGSSNKSSPLPRRPMGDRPPLPAPPTNNNFTDNRDERGPQTNGHVLVSKANGLDNPPFNASPCRACSRRVRWRI